LLKKGIPIKDLELLSEIRSKQFYNEQKALPPTDHIDCESEQTHGHKGYGFNQGLEDFPTKQSQSDETGTDPGPKQMNCSEQCQRYLIRWLSQPKPFYIQKETYTLADVTSGSTQAKLKRELLKKGYVIEHTLQAGKSRLVIPEPTDKAYTVADCSKPRHKSKGGYLHQFCAYHIEQWAKKHGYMVDVEFLLDNGKAVDLLLRQDSSFVFVEIAISEPIEKEISNIQKDLQGGLDPEKIIMAVKDKKVMKKLDTLIQKEICTDGSRFDIEVVYAGNFISREL
jgi:hypothetical protein